MKAIAKRKHTEFYSQANLQAVVHGIELSIPSFEDIDAKEETAHFDDSESEAAEKLMRAAQERKLAERRANV